MSAPAGRVDLTTLRERAEVAGPFYVKTTGRTLLALIEAVEAAREAVIVDSMPGHPDDQNREIQARARRLRAALAPFAAAVPEGTT